MIYFAHHPPEVYRVELGENYYLTISKNGIKIYQKQKAMAFRDSVLMTPAEVER